MEQTLQYDSDAVNKTAKKMNVTVQYVRLVLRGKRNNALIKALYNVYMHGKEVLLDAAAEALEAADIVN